MWGWATLRIPYSTDKPSRGRHHSGRNSKQPQYPSAIGVGTSDIYKVGLIVLFDNPPATMQLCCGCAVSDPNIRSFLGDPRRRLTHGPSRDEPSTPSPTAWFSIALKRTVQSIAVHYLIRVPHQEPLGLPGRTRRRYPFDSIVGCRCPLKAS